MNSVKLYQFISSPIILLIVLIIVILSPQTCVAQEDSTIFLYNLKIVDGYTEEMPKGAKVEVMDKETGAVLDTMWVSMSGTPYAAFKNTIPARDAYHFRFTAPGYETLEFDQSMLDKQGKRVSKFAFEGTKYVWQKPIELDEVTVKASKILMVMKGDTIVYNAANFRMREGSMLDDLVRALPGAKIDEEGRIYVNGEFVSSMLVQGRDFFNGDPRIALRNLPAYTVNKVKVYRKSPEQYKARESERTQAEKNEDPLVMDVRLKREYQQGWLSNYEAGGGVSLDGSKGKWLGRLFALRYTNHSSLAIYGSANNISDDASPTDKGEWKRNTVAGDLKTYMGGISFNLNPKDSKIGEIKSNLQAKHQNAAEYGGTNIENYYMSGNTFQNISSNSSRSTTDLTWDGSIRYNFSSIAPLTFTPKVTYNHNKTNASTVTNYLEGGDSLYTRWYDNGMRSNNTTLSASLRGGYWPMTRWLDLDYGMSVSHGWNKDITRLLDRIHYYSDAAEGLDQARYIELKGRQYAYEAHVKYGTGMTAMPLGKSSINFHAGMEYRYNQEFRSGNRDLRSGKAISDLPSAMTREDMAIDLANSYHTTRMERTNLLSPNIRFEFTKCALDLKLGSDLFFVHRRISDYRNEEPKALSYNEFLNNPYGILSYKINPAGTKKITLVVGQDCIMADLLYMLDVRDSSDPMLISVGNSALRNTKDFYTDGQLSLSWKKLGRRLNVTGRYDHYSDAIGMASILDRQTGVTTRKPMNIDGNYRIRANASYSQFLDKNSRWSIANTLRWLYLHSSDFTADATGADELAMQTVNTSNLSDELRLDWRISDWRLAAVANIYWRKSTSSQQDFETISATEGRYGLDVTFPTLLGFDFQTDVMAYCRRGYVTRSMNTTEWVWNATASRAFGKSHQWLFKVTGFDILSQLKNIRQEINAQGRIESWTNATPSYVVASLTYRIDVKPQKQRK